MKNDRSDFTQGSILKKLALFMLPILGALVLQAAYGAVDLLVVGRFVAPPPLVVVEVSGFLLPPGFLVLPVALASPPPLLSLWLTSEDISVAVVVSPVAPEELPVTPELSGPGLGSRLQAASDASSAMVISKTPHFLNDFMFHRVLSSRYLIE